MVTGTAREREIGDRVLCPAGRERNGDMCLIGLYVVLVWAYVGLCFPSDSL